MPITVGDKVVWSVINFRDRTVIHRLARALVLDKLKLDYGKILHRNLPEGGVNFIGGYPIGER